MPKFPLRYFSTILTRSRVVAVSGGVDSVACLHFLSKHRKEVVAFHFNHKLRPQNDDMQRAVEALAAALGLKLIVATADDFPLTSSSSLESAARSARLAAFAHHLPDKDIVLCHHLNDAAESYLMRCFDGKVHGPYMTIPPATQFSNFRVVRPFLLTPKKGFRRYCQMNNLMEYVVEDESNVDNNYRRNFIRNELLPLVQTRWRGIFSIAKKLVQADYRKFMQFTGAKETSDLASPI